MDNLFAYGTLLCEDIFRLVAGCRSRTDPGILKGFRRLRVIGEEYPGLIPMPGFQVEGSVYHNLSASAWKRLDHFEGDMYERKRVLIELSGKSTCSAFTYVIRPELTHCLEDKEWALADFLAKGKVRFMEMYPGFEKYERASGGNNE